MKTSKTSKVYKLGGSCFTDSRDLHQKVTDTRDYKVYSVFIRTFSPRGEVEAYIRCNDFDEYAYIFHDKDKKDDGSAKEPHFHILCYRKNGFRLTAAIRAFSQNTLIQPVRSRVHSYQYLTHKNDPDKAQYDRSSVHEFHAGGKNTFEHTIAEQRETQYAQMLDDLGQLGYRELALKYGRDYMLHYETYERFMSKVNYESTGKEIDLAVNELNQGFNPDDEVAVYCDGDSDIVRLTASSWFASQIADHLASRGTLPDSREILTWYADLLKQYLDYQREIRLRKNSKEFRNFYLTNTDR